MAKTMDNELLEIEAEMREEGWTHGLKYSRERVAELNRDLAVLEDPEAIQETTWALRVWKSIVEEIAYVDNFHKPEIKVILTEAEAQALYGAVADVLEYTHSPALDRALISIRDAMDGTETHDRSNY